MKKHEIQNLVVLGNATQLISDIAMKVMGKDISMSVGDKTITPSSSKALAAASLKQVLEAPGHA